MDKRKATLRFAGLTAILLSLTASSTAQTYYKRNLPDYDQVRAGLPNMGNAYCVPTSETDLFRFMQLNGMHGMSDYANSPFFHDATSFIAFMGALMGTDPNDGTNSSSALDAETTWTSVCTIAYHTPLVAHISYGPNTYWFASTMRNLVHTGAMVDIAYGRYHQEVFGYARESGHALALAGYDLTGGTDTILLANPINATSSVDPHLTVPTILPVFFNNFLALSRIDPFWTGKDGKYVALIDYMHGMLPLSVGWASTPVITTKALGAKATTITTTTYHQSFPFQLDDGVNRPVRELTVDLPGQVRDWCMDEGDLAIYALLMDGSVNRVDLLSKQITKIATLPSARKLACAGAGLDLYVLTEDERANGLIRFERGTYRQSSISLPKGILRIEPDPSTQGILALYPTLGVVASIDETLATVTSRKVGLPDGDGTPSMAVAGDGSVTVARVGAKTLVQTSLRGEIKQIPLEIALSPQVFQVTDSGQFLVQDGARLITLNADGTLSQSQFDGMSVAPRARFSQSWRAFHPADVSGPGWKNVAPERDQL